MIFSILIYTSFYYQIAYNMHLFLISHIYNCNYCQQCLLMFLRVQLVFPFSLAANFAVLGLKTNVKLDEVKKKYYELAKLCHPDMNKDDQNAQKKFTELTKAYKYITDNYDKENGHFANPQPKKDSSYGNSSKFKNEKRQKTKMEEQAYEDFHEYDDFFRHSKKFRKPRIGEDIYINLAISLQQSVTGVEKPINYTRYEPCLSCAAKPFSSCFSCGGKGEIYDRVNREKVRCQSCSGKGFKNQCISCLGASYVLREVKDKVYIEKGTQDKTILKVDYKGHSGYKADNGNLFITICIEENDRFRVDGNNVHIELDLDFVTAACGGKINIDTVHGPKEVTIDAGTQSGSQLRIFNAGLKSPFSKRMGDQIVKIKIKIPDKLTEKQRILMQKLNELEHEFK